MAKKPEDHREELSFRMVYERFRETLALNESLHRLIADLEDKAAGRSPLLLETILPRIRQGFLDTMVMIKDLNQISGDRFTDLYSTLTDLNAAFERESRRLADTSSTALLLPLPELSSSEALAAGAKMARLGEVRNRLGLSVPDGFAITVSAFNLFMSENGLWERVQQLEHIARSDDPAALDAASREVQQAIVGAPVPPLLAESLFRLFDRTFKEPDARVAIRSSAVGEDLAASHAGQYYTELNVSREALLDAYRLVLASACKPHALWYRRERGVGQADAAMAVGCLGMIRPRVAGVLFTRDFREPDAERIELSITRGLAEKVVQGEEDARQVLLSAKDADVAVRDLLSAPEVREIHRVARRLEEHFDGPQDIEWAIDCGGQLFILQSRPMATPRGASKVRATDVPSARPLLEGGKTACPGAGSGPVVIVRDPSQLASFPKGAVAVAPSAAPAFSRIMTRAAAIVTEIGSPISHMAILAREFGVPAIVGLESATRTLSSEQIVTVDALACRVYEGALDIEQPEPHAAPPAVSSSPPDTLARILPLVTPLHLIDPAADTFAPSHCRSLHDITRFVHEKLYGVMFRFADRAAQRLRTAFELEADLPLSIRVFDVGGGVAALPAGSESVAPGDVRSAPFKALLEGLLDPRIDWKKARAVSAKGFLSVLGESMAGPGLQTGEAGGVSFAVVSECYLNFSIKAGYHFSILDASCDPKPEKNYIHFRFAGGGAGGEYRLRRVRFLSQILAALDFHLETRDDLLTARLENPDRDKALERLRHLGRLTLCSRQLDMLMDSDASPEFFAQAFLRNEFDRF